MICWATWIPFASRLLLVTGCSRLLRFRGDYFCSNVTDPPPLVSTIDLDCCLSSLLTMTSHIVGYFARRAELIRAHLTPSKPPKAGSEEDELTQKLEPTSSLEYCTFCEIVASREPAYKASHLSSWSSSAAATKFSL